jgi:hypothetical protein
MRPYAVSAIADADPYNLDIYVKTNSGKVHFAFGGAGTHQSGQGSSPSVAVLGASPPFGES